MFDVQGENPMKFVINPALILIEIESKRGGGGDHEELKIFLSNHLILSRFNQELQKQEGIHQFLKGNFHAILRTV